MHEHRDIELSVKGSGPSPAARGLSPITILADGWIRPAGTGRGTCSLAIDSSGALQPRYSDGWLAVCDIARRRSRSNSPTRAMVSKSAGNASRPSSPMICLGTTSVRNAVRGNLEPPAIHDYPGFLGALDIAPRLG